MSHLKMRGTLTASILELNRNFLCPHNAPRVGAILKDAPVATVITLATAFLSGVMLSADNNGIGV